jgi:hypothetical protein
LSAVIISDESWIYVNNPETKQQPFQWKMKIKVKSMLIILFDIEEIVHEEFVPAGRTIYSAYYCDVLRQLRENVQRYCPKLKRQNNWLLHHNDEPSHTSFFTAEFF